MQHTPSSRFTSFYWVWPLLACWAGWRVIGKRFDHAVHVDAAQVYLPAARAFLEHGWSYLLTADSYRVVPLAYLWPALWGGDPDWIRLANGGLWVGCVWFLWQTCVLMGGARAGVVAMLLWGFHPELPQYFATELTEPIFLFGLLGWMHAMATIVIARRATRAVVTQAAVMLTVTLLSRPVLQLIAPAALVLCVATLAFWQLNPARLPSIAVRDTVRGVAWSVALGLLLPLALVAKNGVVFGLWGLGTGSGTGLYLGTHPLFQGTEPPFLGFDYDVNALAVLSGGDGDHLSLLADRAAREAALWQIGAMPISDAAAFFGRKLWWWLAHHPAQTDVFGTALRKVRLWELFTVMSYAVFLAYRCRRSKTLAPTSRAEFDAAPGQRLQLSFAVMVFALFAMMLAQLIPILYNSRYSSALLDPLLIPLTAFCVAGLIAPLRLGGTLSKHRWSVELTASPAVLLLPAFVALATAAALTSATYNFARKHDIPVVDPFHMGSTLERLHTTSSDRIHTQGMTPGGRGDWVTTESPAVLSVAWNSTEISTLDAAPPFNALWETRLSARTENGKPCRRAEAAYQTVEGAILQPLARRPLLLPLKGDGSLQHLVTHANGELRPRRAGSFRLVLHCPIGTTVRWQGTRLLESRHPWIAAKHTTAKDLIP